MDSLCKAVYYSRFGQWITLEHFLEFLPRHFIISIPAIEPFTPTTFYFRMECTNTTAIWSYSEEAIMSTNFLTQCLPLVLQFLMPIKFTPLVFSLLLDVGKIDLDVVANMRDWKHSGFSVDMSARIEAADHSGL
jgi:hypothetical protein